VAGVELNEHGYSFPVARLHIAVATAGWKAWFMFLASKTLFLRRGDDFPTADKTSISSGSEKREFLRLPYNARASLV
jgi:hypothetical protein